MVDYYGLPRTGTAAWPGREASSARRCAEKASRVESELKADIEADIGGYPTRFIPFVVMHEFEGLLFSDCSHFAEAIGNRHLAPKLQAIRDQFANPEEIDDSPVTAPSKRVEELAPNYQKPLMGTQAALAIGLEKIRGECPHFSDWLDQLETLGRGAQT